MQHVHRRLPQGRRQHKGAGAAGRQAAKCWPLAGLLMALPACQVHGSANVLASGLHLHHRGMHYAGPATDSDQQVGSGGQGCGKQYAAAAHWLLPHAVQHSAVAAAGRWRRLGGPGGHACVTCYQEMALRGAGSCQQSARRLTHLLRYEQHASRADDGLRRRIAVAGALMASDGKQRPVKLPMRGGRARAAAPGGWASLAHPLLALFPCPTILQPVSA